MDGSRTRYADDLQRRTPPDAVTTRALAACSGIIGALSDESDLDSLLRLIAKDMCGLLGVARCSVYLRDDATGYFRGRVAHTGLDEDERVGRLVAGTEADGFTREIIATGAPVLIDDAATDPRPVRGTMQAWRVRSMLGVPMVVGGEVVGLLFLDDRDRRLDVSEADMTLMSAVAELCAGVVVEAQRAAALRSSLAAEARRVQALTQIAKLGSRLTRALVDGATLEEVTADVALVLRKPVSIYSAAGDLLAVGRLPSNPAAVAYEPPRSIHTPEVDAALVADGPQGARLVAPSPSAGVDHRMIVAPVPGADGAPAGFVLVAEHHGRFFATHRLAAETLANLLAVGALADRSAAAADASTRRSLTRDLLLGCDDDAELERRASSAGILEGGDPHVVCLLAARDPWDRRAALDESRVLEALPVAYRRDGVLVGRLDGACAIFAPVGADDIAGEVLATKRLVEEVARTLAPDGSVIAAISRPCRTLPDFARARTECDQVLESLRRYGVDSGRTTLTADDIGPLRLVLASGSSESVRAFAIDALGPLAEPSSRDERQLLATLGAYVDGERSVRQAAMILGVHENTVRYRLGKIERLCGLDVLGSGDDDLVVRMAVLVLQLQGRVPTAEAESLAATA